MPPRRKTQATEPRQTGREVKLRVPESIMKFIEKQATAEQRPINATIVRMLERVPNLERSLKLEDLADRYQEMFDKAEITFSRYDREIVLYALIRELIEAVDAILDGKFDEEAGPSLRAKLNSLYLVRAEMRLRLRMRKAPTS